MIDDWASSRALPVLGAPAFLPRHAAREDAPTSPIHARSLSVACAGLVARATLLRPGRAGWGLAIGGLLGSFLDCDRWNQSLLEVARAAPKRAFTRAHTRACACVRVRLP
eukprot:6220485-Alexandrium_andersonii.AAC.1